MEGLWFAQDTYSDWYICQRSKCKELLVEFKVLWDPNTNTVQRKCKRKDMLILLSFSLCFSLQEKLKHFCFLIFMVVIFTSGTIIHLFLPETKGKSIMEITEEFNKLNFRKKYIPTTPNHVTEDYTFCTRLWPAVIGSQAVLKGREKPDNCFLTRSWSKWTVTFCICHL